MSRQAPQIVVAAMGDIHAGARPPRVSAELRDLLRAADVAMVNLETPLSNRGEAPGAKSAHLRSSPAAVSLLKELNVSVASLANNHICDWGPEALDDTLRTLHEAGIACVGAGLDREEATRPLIVNAKDLSLGVLAFAEARIQAPPAEEARCGIAPLDREQAVEAVRQLRSRVDCVVVNVHWGYTNYHYPAPEHVALGRALVEAGATLVLGHHPHVVQCVERLGAAAVAYSLGNLVFAAYERHGRPVGLSAENRTGMILMATVSRQAVVSLECCHARYDANRDALLLLSGPKAARRDRFLRRLGRPLARAGYAGFFKRYVLRRFIWRLLRWLDPRRWASLNRDHLAGARSAVDLLRSRSGGRPPAD